MAPKPPVFQCGHGSTSGVRASKCAFRIGWINIYWLGSEEREITAIHEKVLLWQGRTHPKRFGAPPDQDGAGREPLDTAFLFDLCRLE
jgi:hypothetical protein